MNKLRGYIRRLLFRKPSIDQVAWVFEHMDAHLQEGGSFRGLIYVRMGFGHNAYIPLFEAGGMNLTNALHEQRERTRRVS